MLRKLLGFAVLPATVVWLLMVALLVRAWSDRRWRWPLLALVVVYSAAGSPLTSHLLLGSLERPFEQIRPLESEQRWDAVAVMGGGTNTRSNQDPQLSIAGDRVRVAAALFRQQRTPILVTSGSTVDGRHDSSAETAALWQEMGIPADAIVRIPSPRNSAEEIRALETLARERGWKRLGVVTSARHLPRVLALCRRQGLAVDPLPADFRADVPTWGLLALIPTGDSFAGVEEAVWEYLGIAAVHVIGG